MKYFWIFTTLLSITITKAQALTVKDVRVSVTADSAASARDQALDQAHQQAFQKLISENFPQETFSLPSQEVLREIVSGFSIEREKTTPTSYTASLTFQFDERAVRQLQQNPEGFSAHVIQPFQKTGESLEITASYSTHADWQHIKKTLENFPRVQNFSILSLSPQNASLEILYSGSLNQLQQDLLKKGLRLSEQGDRWVVSLQ